MPDSFTQKRTVALHETDATGAMQMAHYLRYMENCEHDFIYSFGYEIDHGRDGLKHGWPRVDVKCEVMEPLRAGDEVEVELLVATVSSKSVAYCFQFHRNGEVVARGYVRPVHVIMKSEDGGIEPSPMPDELATQLTPAADSRLGAFQDWLQ